MNNSDSKDDELTLELLDAIEERGDVSQRHLAAKLGIALGLTNSYLKRCAKKGYVKVKEVPANRYLYYLTPKGFAEKSRLTAQFLSTSLTFYRQSAESCSEIYRLCDQEQWRNVVLCGASDLAEIAYMRSTGFQVNILALYDPEFKPGKFMALPVKRQWERISQADAYVITGLSDPLGLYRFLKRHVSEPRRIMVPRVLRLEAAIRNGT